MKNSEAKLFSDVDVIKIENENYLYEFLEGKKNGAYIQINITSINFINISLGRNIGSYIIDKIYEQIKLIKMNIAVFRISFNKFFIYTEETCIKNIKHMIKTILKNIPNSISKEYHFNIATNIAGIIYKNNEFNMVDMLNKIEISMQNSIKKGNNKYEIYNERYPVNITIDEIEDALKNEDIVIYYQPKIQLQSGKIHGVEALIRWFNRDNGYVSPENLIKFAEDSGYINRLGSWIATKALEDIKALNDKLDENIQLSINISPYQLEDRGFLENLKSIIDDVGFNSELLNLEITENENIEYINKINKTLANIKSTGIKVSIDDFGKGCTSINHIKNYYADEIKIDKSLVDYIKDNPVFIKKLIGMVHTTNALIVAEGVERKFEYKMLKTMGCDLVQGYYCYRPMSFDKLFKTIKDNKVNKT